MTVRVEKSGFVTTIIIDRPKARNAMNPETADLLVAEIEKFENDDSARVAVLFGSGGAFCAGWDLKHASAGAANLELTSLKLPVPPGQPMPRGPLGPTRLSITKPTIAAVDGPAVAGGMELSLWCDLRVVDAESGYFGVYCRRWGVPLLDGGTVRLPRLVGQSRALEIIMTGRTVRADEALRIGLCERVAPAGTVRQAAEALANEIGRFPPECVKADRKSVYETYGLPVREALAVEWVNGEKALQVEGIAGATRFVGGTGRHGDFGYLS